MSKRSIRVQVSDEIEKFLTNLAEELGCLYGGKGSISRLLSEIVDQKLTVIRKENQNLKTNQYIVELQITVKTNFNGTLHDIAEIISKKANILRAKAREIDYIPVIVNNESDIVKGKKYFIIDILISLSSKQGLENLDYIIRELNQIKLSSFLKYHNKIDWVKIGNEAYEIANPELINKNHVYKNNQQLIDAIEKQLITKKLISVIRLIIGYKIIISKTNNISLLLVNVTDIISKNELSILSAQVETHQTKNESTFLIYLQLGQFQGDLIKDLKKLKTLKKDIGKLPIKLIEEIHPEDWPLV